MLKQLIDRVVTAPLVGVDVGSTTLKIVELTRANGDVLLRRCTIVPLEGDDAAKALKRVCAATGLSTAQAALGLASPEVIVRPFQFPTMPKKELESAIQLEAEQAILNGHSLGGMAIDWHILSPNGGEALRGLLAVVPKEVLDARLRQAKTAGLRPSVVDVEGLALWNAFWTLVGSRQAPPKTVLLVNVGAKTTNLVIAKGPDELILVRDLQLGAEALSGGQEREWVEEIRDSLGYARSKAGLRSLEAAYLTGGGSGPSVMTALMSTVMVPVEFWNPLQQLTRDADSPAVEESAGPLLAVAIGLALRKTA
jgi:type IV pilus assembly protein PilM